MTTLHRRTALLAVALLALFAAGCASSSIQETLLIEDTTITRAVQYFENAGTTEGPIYEITVDVPADWIGDFRTKTNANRITFEYIVSETNHIPIFYIEALSDVQYWEQIGSYPGVHVNLSNELDTYFVYSLPLNRSISGLTEEEYDALIAQVPEVVATFDAERSESLFYEMN